MAWGDVADPFELRFWAWAKVLEKVGMEFPQFSGQAYRGYQGSAPGNISSVVRLMSMGGVCDPTTSITSA